MKNNIRHYYLSLYYWQMLIYRQTGRILCNAGVIIYFFSGNINRANFIMFCVRAGMEDEKLSRLVHTLSDKVAELAVNIEKMKLAEYVRLLERPWRLMYINFISGVAKGLGVAVGFTILGALLIFFLRKLVMLNLPLIGGFIAEIVRMVQINMRP